MKPVRSSTSQFSVVDIARECQVSPSTVCRALNNRRDVSPKTRKRILAVCARSGYSKNTAASHLRLRQSNVIAALMTDGENEIFVDKLSLLKQAVLQSGYAWRLYSYRDRPETLRFFHEIVSSRPAGFILSCRLDAEMKRALIQNRIPVVCYDQDAAEFDSVVLDRTPGISEAVRHMLGLGKRRVLLLGAGLENERGRGYQQAHTEHRLPIDPDLVWNVPFGRNLFEYGHTQTSAILRKFNFDAVHAINDACAIGAMRALHESRLAIPEAVAVTGFDNIMAAAHTIPTLSTVAQPKEEMTAACMEFLMKRIKDPRLRRQTVTLTTRFLERESG